ncbi:MAG: transcriptional regulator [Nitrospinaceae bacterium]|nr:MAG: transcriptional regulator [Nitrospinaceae bacterium]
MTETYELTRKVIIDASPETVFSYLTDESKMKEWFGEIVEADAKPGGIFHVGKRVGDQCHGKYVEVVPNEKVVFTWGGIIGLEPGESTVEIKLQSQGASTHLTLRHYNIRLKPAADGFGEGWTEHAFPLLKAVCEGGKPDGLCFESGHECKTD